MWFLRLRAGGVREVGASLVVGRAMPESEDGMHFRVRARQRHELVLEMDWQVTRKQEIVRRRT